MKPYRLYVLDLDGTLYRGNDPVEGAAEAVRELRNRGALIRFITNNSSQTVERAADKLRRLGFEADSDEVVSSALLTAAWMREEGLSRPFVLGDPGLCETLRRAGFEPCNGDPPELATEEADSVVVGICRAVTYRWIGTAMNLVTHGARFVATNSDATYPVEGGRLEPGAGSLVAAIQACSGVQPFVVGKPNPYGIEFILRETGVAAKDALVVGDRMDTDIECGRRAGCDTHLVLTGVATEAPFGQSSSQNLSGIL